MYVCKLELLLEVLLLSLFVTPCVHVFRRIDGKFCQTDGVPSVRRNGHGTVVFSPAAETAMRAASPRLGLLVDVVNQTVGDAISDMLLVEAILADRGWSAQDWDKQYTDFPNRLAKVRTASGTIEICF